MSNCARTMVHDASMKFRVNRSLMASAEEMARREGMSLSELLRHALRHQLRNAA